MRVTSIVFCLCLCSLAACGRNTRPDGIVTEPLPLERQPITRSRIEAAFRSTAAEDPEAWAADLHTHLEALDVVPTRESVCTAVAVIDQGSGFRPDPPVEGMDRRLDRWLLEMRWRFEPRGGPAFAEAVAQVLDTAAEGQSQSFRQRLLAAGTQSEVHRIYLSLVDTFEDAWPRAFEDAGFGGATTSLGADDWNPLHTAGCMQAEHSWIDARAKLEGDRRDEARARAYTREGCLWYGVSRLLGHAARYDTPVYRFADYLTDPWASRNAAFQETVKALTGRPVPLDGRLVVYEGTGDVSLRPSPTMLAILAMRDRYSLPMSETRILRDLSKERSLDLEDSDTYFKVNRVWENEKERPPAYARIPEGVWRTVDAPDGLPLAQVADDLHRRYNSCLLRIGS